MSAIILIGPSGVGKTTIGNSLEKNSDKIIFFDIDKDIAELYNIDNVSEYLIQEGANNYLRNSMDRIEYLDGINNEYIILCALGSGALRSLSIEQKLKFYKDNIIYLDAHPNVAYNRWKNKNNPNNVTYEQYIFSNYSYRMKIIYNISKHWASVNSNDIDENIKDVNKAIDNIIALKAGK